MKILIDLLERRRLWLAICFGLLSLIACFGLSRLSFDDDYKDLFKAQDARSRDFKKLIELFGAGDSDCIVLFESEDILDRESLEVIRRFHASATKIDGIESVVSLYSLRRPIRVGRMFLPLFPGGDADEELFDRARKEVVDHPMAIGVLLSKDRKASLVLARIGSDRQSVDRDVEPILQELRRLSQESSLNSRVRCRLTGMPSIRVETIRRLQSEHVGIMAVGVLLSTLIAWFLLRRWAAVFLVVAPAIVGVVWTLGALGLFGKNLDAINIVIPAIVLVIGVCDSIHLMFHFRDAQLHGLNPIEAIAESVREIGGACSLTAISTGIGFASLYVSQDKIIRQFGVFGAMGVVLTFLSVITLLPLLCSTRLGAACIPKNRESLDPRIVVAMDRWLGFLAKHTWSILLLCIVMACCMSYVTTKIQAEYSFLENLTNESEVYSALRTTEEKFGGMPILQILIEWPVHESERSKATLELLAATHQLINRSSPFSSPTSILSLIESLPGKSTNIQLQANELAYIPKELRRSLVDTDARTAVVTAYAPDAGAIAIRPKLDELSRKLQELEQHFSGYTITPTGFSVVSTYRTTSMIMSMLTGLSLELIFIFVIISLALRSPILGLVSFPSNVFPLIATAAIIVVTGESLNYANVLAFNICLGIAVDDTIHFLSRYRREVAIAGDRNTAIRRSFHAVAPVMVTQTILMVSGFGAGLFCAIPTIRAFSQCACMALLLALISEAVILPCLLFAVSKGIRPCSGNSDPHISKAIST